MNEHVKENMMRRVALGDCLRRSSRRYPNKVAVKQGNRSVTYKELNNMANQLGNSLIKRGLTKDAKIAFVAANCVEFFIAFYGIAKAGMTIVPINPVYKPSELIYSVNDSDCEALIFDGRIHPLVKESLSGFEKVKHIFSFDLPNQGYEDLYEFMKEGSTDEVEVHIEDRDVVAIYYTGGTTSFPRGAQLTHLSIFVDISEFLIDLHFSPEDRTGTALPLFHVAMFVCSQFSMFTGGTLVLIPQVDPKVIMEAIEKEKLTNILLIPPLFRAILYHPEFGKYDLSSLRLVGYFGSVMPEELIHEVMDKLCPNLYLSFGQTEMSPCVTCFKPEDHLRKIKSLGISTVHCEIAVMDNDGNFLPPGETGEFVYRSPSTMNGYYNKAEDNKKAFEYGWFHSGDLGYLDEDGFVYFVDRKKDMIKSGGENLASIEVEKLIYQIPKVQEVHVIGLPHERWVEAVTAFIIPKPGEKITEEETIAFCKEKMAGFKVPKRVIFGTELPRNSVGKVLKYKLKEKYKDLYKAAT